MFLQNQVAEKSTGFKEDRGKGGGGANRIPPDTPQAPGLTSFPNGATAMLENEKTLGTRLHPAFIHDRGYDVTSPPVTWPDWSCDLI